MKLHFHIINFCVIISTRATRYRMLKVIQHFGIFLEDTKHSTKISHLVRGIS